MQSEQHRYIHVDEYLASDSDFLKQEEEKLLPLHHDHITCVRLAETRPNVAPEAMVMICREGNIHAMATVFTDGITGQGV